MKKVNHWINGKNVAGNDYSRPPIRQRVKCWQMWPPAVKGDQSGGSGSERGVPEMGQSAMKERARLMRRLGDLIDQNVLRSPRWKPRTRACRSIRPKMIDPTRFSQL